MRPLVILTTDPAGNYAVSIIALGNGATRVSGDQMVGGPVTTRFFGYPVLASYNQGTAPAPKSATCS